MYKHDHCIGKSSVEIQKLPHMFTVSTFVEYYLEVLAAVFK